MDNIQPYGLSYIYYMSILCDWKRIAKDEYKKADTDISGYVYQGCFKCDGIRKDCIKYSNLVDKLK